MRSSLKDVARLARVSPITVSRTLSGTHFVRPETKARVLKAVGRLHYVPDLLARGLVSRRSCTLGLVVPELANPFFVTLVDAIQGAASSHELLLVVSQSGRQRPLEAQSVEQFQQLRVAGILAVPSSKVLSHLSEAAKRGTPSVVVARRAPIHDFVAVDDVAGGRFAAAHLLSLGHRKIACVAPEQPENIALQDRLRSFEKEVQAGGARIAAGGRIRAASLDLEAGFEAAERFLSLRNRPTAVFLTADHLAIGFLRCLRNHGVRVPEDVTLLGYDNIPLSQYLDVPLTTIQLPVKAMGVRAVEILLSRLEAGPEGGVAERRQILLAPELVVRKSSGPPSG